MEGDVGDEDGHEGNEDDGRCEAGTSEVIPRGDGLEDASTHEGEGDGVGADHPLAVLPNVAIARGEDGGSGGDEPCSSLNGSGDGEVDGLGGVIVGCHGDGERGGKEDGPGIDAAQYPMKLRAFEAQAAGELQRADEQGGDSPDDVRDDQPEHGAQIGQLLRRMEKRKLAVEDD